MPSVNSSTGIYSFDSRESSHCRFASLNRARCERHFIQCCGLKIQKEVCRPGRLSVLLFSTQPALRSNNTTLFLQRPSACFLQSTSCLGFTWLTKRQKKAMRNQIRVVRLKWISRSVIWIGFFSRISHLLNMIRFQMYMHKNQTWTNSLNKARVSNLLCCACMFVRFWEFDFAPLLLWDLGCAPVLGSLVQHTVAAAAASAPSHPPADPATAGISCWPPVLSPTNKQNPK